MTEEEKITALASFAKEVIPVATWDIALDAEDARMAAITHGLGTMIGDDFVMADWLSRIQKEGSGSGADAFAPIATGNSVWRPIAEAPTDGTRFLASIMFDPPHRYFGAGPRADVISWSKDSEGEGYWDLPALNGVPTHFQPLPSPPIPETENGQATRSQALATAPSPTEAKVAAYEAALIDLAAFDDHGGNASLSATGSYGSFDEPGSTSVARETLAQFGITGLAAPAVRSEAEPQTQPNPDPEVTETELCARHLEEIAAKWDDEGDPDYAGAYRLAAASLRAMKAKEPR